MTHHSGHLSVRTRRIPVRLLRALGCVVVLAVARLGVQPLPSPAAAPAAPRTQVSTSGPSSPVASDPMSSGSSSLAPLYGVKVRTEMFVDTSRKVAVNGSAPGQAQRPLPTLVIEPQPKRAGQRFALLVFGHGLGGEPADYQALLTAVAARGYVVAAPTFPLTNKRTPGGANLLDELNQAADMTFVIGAMLKPSNASSALIDPTRVAVAGHSLGAITVIDLIGNSCCRDRRVKAAVAISGSLNVFRQGKVFGSQPTPVLFVHGDRDPTVPYGLGYSTYQAARAPKHFLTVIGGGHLFDLQGVPGSRATIAPLVADATVRFLDAQLGASGTPAVQAALGQEAAQNPKLLRYESVAR